MTKDTALTLFWVHRFLFAAIVVMIPITVFAVQFFDLDGLAVGLLIIVVLGEIHVSAT